MFRELRLIPLCLVALMIGGCSDSAKPESPTLFAGHAIGESSMAWAAKEPSQDIDPLGKCQQIIRSHLLEQSLESAQKCREFVDRGAYLIAVRDSNGERLFRFTNWKLSMIVWTVAESERSRTLREFDSRFLNRIPGEAWSSKDGTRIEVLPIDQLKLFTGRPVTTKDGFLVVVSDPRQTVE